MSHLMLAEIWKCSKYRYPFCFLRWDASSLMCVFSYFIAQLVDITHKSKMSNCQYKTHQRIEIAAVSHTIDKQS